MAARVGVVRRRRTRRCTPDFGLRPAMGVVAFDEQRARLDAGLFARCLLELDLVAVLFAPALVHAHSMRAQSWLSVPPAPACTSTKVSFVSAWPEQRLVPPRSPHLEDGFQRLDALFVRSGRPRSRQVR